MYIYTHIISYYTHIYIYIYICMRLCPNNANIWSKTRPENYLWIVFSPVLTANATFYLTLVRLKSLLGVNRTVFELQIRIQWQDSLFGIRRLAQMEGMFAFSACSRKLICLCSCSGEGFCYFALHIRILHAKLYKLPLEGFELWADSETNLVVLTLLQCKGKLDIGQTRSSTYPLLSYTT